MDAVILKSTLADLLKKGKGIHASDASEKSFQKRFEEAGIENAVENRRKLRQIMFSTAGIEEYVSGVIMNDESIRMNGDDGASFVKMLTQKGIVPGIKVDRGLHLLAMSKGESVTEGLDELRERLIEYRGLGARFAKWRAAFTIGDGLPSDMTIHANAQAMARYAGLCQEENIVPIIEPEVLMTGSHDSQICAMVTANVHKIMFEEMKKLSCRLDLLILKMNMIVAGKDGLKNTAQDVADKTLQVIRDNVPSEVAGIVFLSGGQSAEDAVSNLNAIAKGAQQHQLHEWFMTFSYERALEAPTMQAWKGQDANIVAAQAVYLTQARACSQAQQGLL